MSAFKKVFVISLVLLLIVGVFSGIYNFAFRDNTGDDEQSQEDKDKNSPFTNNAKPLPENAGRIFPLTDEAIVGPTISQDDESVKYYAKNDGSVYETSFSGTNKKTVTKNSISGLVYILWSPKKDKVITITSQGGNTKRYLYDNDTKTAKEFNPAMDNISWDNTGEKIFYRFTDPKSGERFISMADPDGSNWKNLTRVGYKFISIAPVPHSSLVSFWNLPNGHEETIFQTISSIGGEPKTLLTQKFGADYLWSPNGEKVLVSSAESKGSSKISLSVMNSNGGEYKNLNVPTLASKCVWSKNGKTVYFSLPGSIPEGSVMPNDYNEKKFTTKDSFWRVDITTGKQDRIVELNEIKEGIDARNLFLSPSEDYLFFINRINDKLYGIEL